jgi:hypothetical protein
VVVTRTAKGQQKIGEAAILPHARLIEHPIHRMKKQKHATTKMQKCSVTFRTSAVHKATALIPG